MLLGTLGTARHASTPIMERQIRKTRGAMLTTMTIYSVYITLTTAISKLILCAVFVEVDVKRLLKSHIMCLSPLAR